MKPKTFDEAKAIYKPLRRTGFQPKTAQNRLTRSPENGTGNALTGLATGLRRGKARSHGIRKSVLRVRSRAEVAAGGDSARSVKAECDMIVSQIIALEAQDCFVCGIPAAVTDLHPGHFITRKVLAIRWDRRNYRPQCNWCNRNHNESPAWYRGMLVLDIGEDEVRELERIGKENPRVEYSQLLEIRDGLRTELARVADEARCKS